MTRVRAGSLTIGVLVCAAALLPSAASAGLPKPTTALIVPFASMDGVSLGTTRAKAMQQWGAGSRCSIGTGRRETCAWFAASSTDFPVESGVLELAGGRVCGMLIRGGTNTRSGSLSITRLKKWKTRAGVGIGSKLSAAKLVLGKLVVRKRAVTTAFLAGTAGRTTTQVGAITIYKDGCNVT